jgi:hypothetical protein
MLNSQGWELVFGTTKKGGKIIPEEYHTRRHPDAVMLFNLKNISQSSNTNLNNKYYQYLVKSPEFIFTTSELTAGYY